jgi:alpha-N-acetylglucosaminidase
MYFNGYILLQCFRSAGSDLIELLEDLEMLLASDKHFLLGTWIRDARNRGHTVAEKNLMEYNARNQVTLWGPTGEV